MRLIGEALFNLFIGILLCWTGHPLVEFGGTIVPGMENPLFCIGVSCGVFSVGVGIGIDGLW